MSAYTSLRLANDILDRAAHSQIEEDFMVDMGDKWVNGQIDDDLSEQFPAFSELMTDLDVNNDPYDLIKAFELLVELGNKHLGF